MSNELICSSQGNQTLYALLLNGAGQIYNGSGFETPQDANWANYPVTMTEVENTEIYRGDMPPVATGSYSFIARVQSGGSPAITDDTVDTVQFDWGASSVGTKMIVSPGWANLTLYAIILDTNGRIWNTATSAFETPQDANWGNYDIALSEAENTEIYIGTIPALDSGGYSFVVREQTGGAPAVTDGTADTLVFTFHDGSAPSANAYISLAASDNSLIKKFRVILGGYKPTMARVQARRRTVTGKIDNQEGPVLQRWEYVLKVYETDPTDPNKADADNTGYGTKDHLETLFKLNDPGGTPSNIITLTDHGGTAHSVQFVGEVAPVPISVAIIGVAAEHRAAVILEETTAVA